MEIVRILIYSKDGSLLPLYPVTQGCIDFEISEYRRFLLWCIDNADAKGIINLDESSYDTIMYLTQMDDLPCPSSFVIEFRRGSQNFALSLSYSRNDFTANIVGVYD